LRGFLADEDGDIVDEEGFCCLGVYLDVNGPGQWNDANDYEYGMNDAADFEYLEADWTEYVQREEGITKAQHDHLTRMNDGWAEYDTNGSPVEATRIRKHTFAEIADWIEENIA
jgi:hypothetical protein